MQNLLSVSLDNSLLKAHSCLILNALCLFPLRPRCMLPFQPRAVHVYIHMSPIQPEVADSLQGACSSIAVYYILLQNIVTIATHK
jgi:hypothetical protein